MSGKYIGIDIGGTNLKAGLVDAFGALLSCVTAPLQWRGEEDFVGCLTALALEAMEKGGTRKEEILAVGMGVPGEVDTNTGTIRYTCNIPLSDFPVVEGFRKTLDVPVALDNDANCAALGEYYAGAGRGSRDFIIVTLGTGIGGGIIVDGTLLHGCNGAAGEVGHMVVESDGVPCSCGRRGCWEQYASASGLIRMTREAMDTHPKSALWRVCDGRKESIDGRSAFLAAKEYDDAAAWEVCQKFVRYLGIGVVNLINLYQPEVLCIGGGVSHADDDILLHPLQKIVEAEHFGNSHDRVTRVVKAELGNDAGIIGAAYLNKMQ